ncbi:DUF2934 domain-containing protein [Paraburkholderia rhynchosiae]|uniref:DUF2934 domain-containing protein n=1 Tax=Paraburkholderia rhynchosiae TaxID=487049 RepID=A0A2N7W614_9BURK|nr:DUF2934 domain-containing protein [Paraburkholderia rhynchosiae]PMS24844.1 hypothetical protein C0Z16_30350 [Paraburkholderia rhynchosiae]CAB3725243.1 hypothetical protein LMG27174_05304 [Paraburkholderia rhynchosiae]
MDGLPGEPTVEDRIRKRAYELWESDGSPEGRADDYWTRAQAQIEAEGEAGDAEPPAPVDQSSKGRRAADAPDEDSVRTSDAGHTAGASATTGGNGGAKRS